MQGGQRPRLGTNVSVSARADRPGRGGRGLSNSTFTWSLLFVASRPKKSEEIDSAFFSLFNRRPLSFAACATSHIGLLVTSLASGDSVGSVMGSTYGVSLWES